jgi:hypothetical protein
MSFSILWKKDVTSLISKFKNYSSILTWNSVLLFLGDLFQEDAADRNQTEVSSTSVKKEVANVDLYEVIIRHNTEEKRLYTYAASEEEASNKFHRYIVCQWVGYPWDTPESLMCGTFDKIKNNDTL